MRSATPPPDKTAPNRPEQPRPRNANGTTSLILGIFAVASCSTVSNMVTAISDITPFAALLTIALPGVLFGHAGWSNVKQGRATNKGVTITGLILGYVAVGFAVLNILPALG